MDKNLKEKKVSIIIPSYNDSRFLPESIESALAQTHKDIEVIVVNDGSTNKVDVEFFKNFPYKNVKLINKENEGLAQARNTGIEESSSEFFVPLDADDKIDPTFVEKTMEKISMHDNIGVVYTDQKWFGEEEKIQVMMDFDFEYLLVRNHISVCSLVRKSAWEKVRKHNKFGYNPNMLYGYEDWDFWISVSESGFKFECLHEPLFFYRRRGDSMSSNTIKKHNHLVNQLVENHPNSYSKNYKTVIAELNNLYADRSASSDSLSNKIQSQWWLFKRFLRNLFRKS